MTSISVKLQSSDGVIFVADQDIIKQMVTIQTMLENPGDGDAEEIIPIYTIKGDILEKVIEWTSNYKVAFGQESTNKIWSDQFFKNNQEKIFKIIEAADYLEVNNLINEGEAFVDHHFEDLTKTEAFSNLSPKKLEAILVRDSLYVQNEEVILNSLESWITNHPQKRSTSLENFISHIRAHFLSNKTIEENLKPFLLKHKMEDLISKLNYTNEKPRHGYEQCIVALHEENKIQVLKYLDLKSETWHLLTTIPSEFSRSECKLCCVQGNIYLVGGNEGTDVSEYNPRTKSWRKMPSLQMKRDGNHMSATLARTMTRRTGTSSQRGR